MDRGRQAKGDEFVTSGGLSSTVGVLGAVPLFPSFAFFSVTYFFCALRLVK
jgi:hypothetical protein